MAANDAERCLAEGWPAAGRCSANELLQVNLVNGPFPRGEAETDALRLGQASANHRPSDHRADGRRP